MKTSSFHHFAAVLLLAAPARIACAQFQMIDDPHFQTGVTVLHPTTGVVQGPLQYTTANGTPRWQLAQWNSKQSIYGATPSALGGATQWQNSYKSVVEGPTSAPSADLRLGVNSINEYGNKYRSVNDPWPALLVQQSISEPGGWRSSTAPSLARMTQASLSLEVQLTKADNRYTTGYNASIHASQFPLYFTVQNLNPASSGYGRYLWFGIGIYDDRYTVTDSFQLMDAGTGSLIYSIGLSDLGKAQGPQLGQWLSISADILPLMKNALTYAWAHGILTESQDYADYKIGAMNIGWEVTGLADVNMQVRDLDLTVTAIPEPETSALVGVGLMASLLFSRRGRRFAGK
jgi:hypothetical protein